MAAKPHSPPPAAAPAVAPAAAGPDFEIGKLGPTPIRDLALSLEESPLAPVLAELEHELEGRGVRRPRPRFYLSTEWGVPFGTIAIARRQLRPLSGAPAGGSWRARPSAIASRLAGKLL